MTFTAALIAFAAITFFAISMEIFVTYANQGFGFGFSSNRPSVEKGPFALRVERTYRNQIESAAYIVPIFVVGAITSLDGPYVALATLLVIIGRAAFVLLYYTGIPFIRIPAFSLASFGTLYLGILLAHSGTI
ncbi:MAG: MAPEG family protein [Pseudomonadota bacterium]